MALQTGLPYETVRARIIEAHGYCKVPPKDGVKVMFMQRDLDSVDERAIRAIRRVVDDFVSAAEVKQIRNSYRAAEMKDAYWIAWDCHIHPYVAIAVLRNLNARGELAF